MTDGSRAFEGTDLSGSRFSEVNLDGARFLHSTLYGVRMRGVELVDADIDGYLENVTVNGVAIMPLVEAELDRRFPNRVLFRPTTADGFRAAWDRNDELWAATVERARRRRPRSETGQLRRVSRLESCRT